MEQDPHLLVYRASAGSGKTFTLAVEYIRQLIEDPFAYRRILAVTFTNKATAEMKERILSQLYGIAHKDPASDGYLNKIREHSSKSDAEIREAAAQALKNIIHDYSRFRIETIDSFFQSVMRNLARELELGANLNIELNNGEVLSDAVDSMIEKLDRRSPVLHWLLEYIENRISDNSRWNVSGEIKSFGKNIFNEVYLEKGQNLREKLGDTSFIAGYRKRLNLLKQETEEIMQGFSQHFEEVLEQHGLEPNDLKSGKNGIGSYFRKLANGNFKEDVRNATVEKCLEAPENWTTKTSVNKDVIIGLAQSELMETLATAEELRPRANLKVNSCSLASRYLYNLPLLVHIDQEVRRMNEAHNRFLLSDTNALLHGLIREGDASFIYEKIGTTIDVVMIDEFQDTSRMQWENFHLLLEECLAQKDGSLIVGDIKQSIYRWRNGDWRILAGLDHDPSFRVHTEPLKTNWRSEANIIHFNNLFFEETCRQLAQEDASIGKEGYPQILDIYQDVAQKTQKQEKGFVRVSLIPDNRDRDVYQETVLHELSKQVDELVQSGIRENEIAILIRKNNLIPLIADYFDKNTSYHIVSDEAFCMDASTAVCMLVDCLRYLANPDDRIACARLAVAYQHDVLEKDIDLNTVLLNRVEDYLPQAFTEQLEKWRLLPLYELLEQLFILFEMKRIHYTDSYLLSPYHPVSVFVIGAGGTGSQVVTNLARMDVALRSLGHPGLHVTVFDGDTVSEANIGRQLFSPSEVGLNKAVALVTRINRFFGMGWTAEARRYPCRTGETMTANITITCTDNVRSRLDLWRFLKKHRDIRNNDYKTPLYWMDFGNAQFTGQVLVGTVRNKIRQPSSKEFVTVPKLNVITEEVSYPTIDEKDSGPSCSLAEALERQDLFVNSMLAQAGCALLWKMLREGRTLYRGAYMNMETMRIIPISI